MGSTNDTMHEFERKELKKNYPFSEGWKQASGQAGAGCSGAIYTFTRDLWVGREQVIVISMYKPVVSGEEIAEIRTRLINGHARSSFALMVPAGSDCTAVPDDIRVITMSSFGYDAGKLVWLTRKKNAKKIAGKPVAPESS